MGFAEVTNGSGVDANVGEEVVPTDKEVTADGIGIER